MSMLEKMLGGSLGQMMAQGQQVIELLNQRLLDINNTLHDIDIRMKNLEKQLYRLANKVEFLTIEAVDDGH